MRSAGIPCVFEAAHIDEGAVKKAMVRQGAAPEKISERLARDKARAIGLGYPGKVILGADQILVCEGRIFDKPCHMQDAESHLRFFRGKRHTLYTSYALMRDGRVLNCQTLRPCLVMRNFSDDFLTGYLQKSGPEILNTVGCYMLEESGLQLFSEIDGDYFTILGLPLLNVMENLRKLNILEP